MATAKSASDAIDKAIHAQGLQSTADLVEEVKKQLPEDQQGPFLDVWKLKDIVVPAIEKWADDLTADQAEPASDGLGSYHRQRSLRTHH